MKIGIPPQACDCHLHVYNGRFPSNAPVPLGAEALDYMAKRAGLGFLRAVVVQPRPYGTDSSVILDAIGILGQKNTRGVTVLPPDVTDKELQRLHDGGIRGTRFSLYTTTNAAVGFDAVERTADRVKAMGWHLQLHWTADQIVEYRNLLLRLPTPVVFDHMARLPASSARHPAFDVVLGLAQDGLAWIKISGPYLESHFALKDGYPDVAPIARRWIDAVADRLVWGSDWPHVDRPGGIDDEKLVALLIEWSQTEACLRKILVHNPAQLYDFDAAPDHEPGG